MSRVRFPPAHFYSALNLDSWIQYPLCHVVTTAPTTYMTDLRGVRKQLGFCLNEQELSELWEFCQGLHSTMHKTKPGALRLCDSVRQPLAVSFNLTKSWLLEVFLTSPLSLNTFWHFINWYFMDCKDWNKTVNHLFRNKWLDKHVNCTTETMILLMFVCLLETLL